MRMFFFIYAVLVFSFVSIAQVPNDKYLEIVDYEELLTLFNVYDGDTLVQERVIGAYLDRAKKDNDTIKIARSYDRMARIYSSRKNILYADSLITYTRDWQHITYPALGYIIKGYEYGNIGNLELSYNSYFLAYELAQVSGNLSQQVYILDRLVFLKIAYGDKQKALKLQVDRDRLVNSKVFELSFEESSRKAIQNQTLQFFEEQKLLSAESFVLCYLALGDIDMALQYLELHQSLLKGQNILNKETGFIWEVDVKMEIDYYQKKYEEVIKGAIEIEKLCHNLNDNYYKINANLFRGLALIEQSKWAEAKKNLSIAEGFYFMDQNILMPESSYMLFDGLERIAEHENNLVSNILYLDKLIDLDNERLENYKTLEPKFIRTFETPRLIKSKEEIIKILERRNSQSVIVIGVSIVLFIFFSSLSYYYFRQKVTYRRRFEKLMKQEGAKETNTSGKSSANESTAIIAEDIVADILKRLNRFETNEEFLRDNVTLMTLAKKMHTNSSYLSRVVNHHKMKSFSQYLNDLRIDYAVLKIKTDSVFRRYTVEAIASECGYNTAASFSRSFYKKTGIYPSFMIAEISKQEEGKVHQA